MVTSSKNFKVFSVIKVKKYLKLKIVWLSLKSNKNTKLISKFKQRSRFWIPDIKFIFGDTALFTKRQFRVEGVYFRVFKKYLRKKLRKKIIKFSTQKYWIRYSLNTYLSKKSKNARMGSGKGLLVRKAFTIAANKSFIEFKNYNLLFLKALCNRFYFKLNIKLYKKLKN